MKNSIISKISTAKTRGAILFSACLALPLILPTGAKAADANAWQPAEMPTRHPHRRHQPRSGAEPATEPPGQYPGSNPGVGRGKRRPTLVPAQ